MKAHWYVYTTFDQWCRLAEVTYRLRLAPPPSSRQQHHHSLCPRRPRRPRRTIKGLFLTFLVFVGPGCMIFLLVREEYYMLFGSSEEDDVDKMADHFTSENPLHGSGGEAEFPTLVLEDGIELTFNEAYNMRGAARGETDDGGEARLQFRRSLTDLDAADDGGESQRRIFRDSIAEESGGTGVGLSVENPLHAVTVDVGLENLHATVDKEFSMENPLRASVDGAAAAKKQAVEVAVAESENEDEVESVWAVVETDDGRTYYHNTVTDVTSWTRPEGLKSTSLATKVAEQSSEI